MQASSEDDDMEDDQIMSLALKKIEQFKTPSGKAPVTGSSKSGVKPSAKATEKKKLKQPE